MSKLLFLVLITCFLLSTSVIALGVTPARTNVLFESGNEVCSSFTVLNIEGMQQRVELSLGGDLAPYVTMRTRELLFEADETSRTLGLCVTLPNALEPGYHSALVFVTSDVPRSRGETILSFRTSLVTEMRVFVPSGALYLKSEVFATPRPDGTVSFEAFLRNSGEEAIDNVVMTVDIQSKIGASLARLEADPVNVPALGLGSATVVWPETLPGEYTARVTIAYRDTKSVHKKPFIIDRERHLSVRELRITDYQQGQVVAFEATVRNEGTTELSPVVAEVQVLDEKHNVLASGTSEPLTLAGEERKKIIVYVDASSLAEEHYTATLSLRMNDVSYPQKEFSIVLSERASVSPLTGYVASELSFRPSRTLVVGFGILLLVLVNVWWFWRGRRKKESSYGGIPQPS